MERCLPFSSLNLIYDSRRHGSKDRISGYILFPKLINDENEREIEEKSILPSLA